MTATLPGPTPRISPADLDERGRLTVPDGTVERIAARAVTEVDGPPERA